MQALAQAPWLSDVDPLEGVVLHEPSSALAQAAE
jgi:hypothetical protein